MMSLSTYYDVYRRLGCMVISVVEDGHSGGFSFSGQGCAALGLFGSGPVVVPAKNTRCGRGALRASRCF